MNLELYSAERVPLRKRAIAPFASNMLSFKAAILFVLAVFSVSGIAHANPTVAPRNSVDQIVGLRDSSGKALGYYPGENQDLVGNAGSTGSRYGAVLVMGYTLPTLPAGTVVDAATFKFEIKANRDNSGKDASVQVHMLDVVDPDSSGTSYFFNGPLDSNAETAFVDSTYIDVGNITDEVLHADDLHDQTYVLSGDALIWLKSFYGGDHIPERSEVFFRFSLDVAMADTSALDRYRIDLANDESTFEITSAAPETTPPTLAASDIVDDADGGPVGSGIGLTYTVTFSEDIDEATVDASDFGNAGTVSVSIGTITETAPGVFTVPVTPTGDGTLQLQVNASAVITDLIGNALDTAAAIPDDTTITVTTGNLPPEWTTNSITRGAASANTTYSGTLAGEASDPNLDSLTYAKVDGNAWLVVDANGSLGGTPGAGDLGVNSFTVSVSDGTAPAVEATLNIEVLPNGTWRSSLYPSDWTPPNETASFYDDKIIQDFSYAGYKGGQEPVPTITGPIFDVTDAAYGADPTGVNDSTVAIQSAIDAAGIAGGGVAYLPAGDYKISPQGGNTYCLLIDRPNVVLRGTGADSTFLTNTATNMRSKDVIRVRAASVTTEASVSITADLNGPTCRLPMATPGSFAIGDVVRLQWTFTDEWITEHNQQSYWREAGGNPADARYLREVTAVNEAEGWIEVDVPTRYTIKARDNAQVTVVNGLLENVGVESLAIGNVQHPGTDFGEGDYSVAGTAAYDAHQSYILEMRDVRDAWITGVESFQPVGNTSTCHMLSNGILVTSSCRITVSDCSMSRPQYGGGGGNGYMYRLQYSNECLVKNSVADFSRHGIVLSHAGTSGNVFFRCEDRETGRATGSTGSYNTNGSGSDHHMHFSHSNLFDSCRVYNSFYTASHRGNSGTTPHGLSSAHGIYWNTSGDGTRYGTIVQSNQGRYGYVIGTSGTRSSASNSTSGNTAPADHVEGIGSGDSLFPSSLYLDQIARRVSPTVTYAANGADGGTVPVDANSPYSQGESVTVLGVSDMTRNGFSFDGWNTAADGTGIAYSAGNTFTINNHVTLYAQWAGESYTLTFNANSGDTPSPATKTVTNGEFYGALATSTRTGYNLKGWFTEPTGGTEVSSSDIVDTLSDLTLYAQWSQPPAVDAGADQTASLSGALTWTPAELSMEAWLDAADPDTITHSSGAVSQWDDKSGNDKHLGQPAGANQPMTGAVTVNGENALQFTDASLYNATGTNANIKSVVMVSKNNAEITSASGAAGMLSIYGTSISSGDGLGGATSALTDEILSIFDEDEPSIYVDRQGVSSSTLSSISAGTHMYSYVRSSDWFIGLDGSGDLRDLSSGTRHDLLLSNGFGVGGMLRNTTAPGNFFDGAICEVILLSTTLSETDRQKLEGYLAHRWGLVGNLPTNHPHKSAAPTIAGATVNLDGTVSDPENDALTTAWSMVSGPAGVEFGDASAVDTTASFIANGSYTLRLTAGDGAGTTADDIIVQVGDVPTVTAWPTAADITEGQSLADTTLSGGSASVAGSFSYDAPSTTPSAGIYVAAATFTPTDSVNYLSVSGSVDVTVQASTEPFNTWAAIASGVSFDGDANVDGIADGLGWLLGATTPSQAANALLPSVNQSDNDLLLDFNMLKSFHRGTAVIQLQYSNDLGVGDLWADNTVTVPEVSSTIAGVEFLVTPVDGTNLNHVEARIPSSAGLTDQRMFARLRGLFSPP